MYFYKSRVLLYKSNKYSISIIIFFTIIQGIIPAILLLQKTETLDLEDCENPEVYDYY